MWVVLDKCEDGSYLSVGAVLDTKEEAIEEAKTESSDWGQPFFIAKLGPLEEVDGRANI